MKTTPLQIPRLMIAAATLLSAGFSFAADPSGFPVKDGWSEPVGGLQARLVLANGRVVNGTRLPEVYLELHNASDVGNPMEFNFDPGKSIHFDLSGAGGKPGPKPAGFDIDGFVFGPFHITLPRDGTLRLPITWGGYGVPRDGGTMLGFEGACWLIPPGDQGGYLLSATIEVPETPRDPERTPRWHGTLKLPAVKAVPEKQPQAANQAAPLSYRDPDSGIVVMVESDRHHVVAVDKHGKLLWSRQPATDGKLPPYSKDRPQPNPAITWMGALTARQNTGLQQTGSGKFVGISFNSRQAGAVDLKTGDFTFLGQN